ncbi:MAG: hypothetical protein KGJ02_07580 [Verrucomicrobiota bacterium]|nr:hypothetical protein [Verrucomicrobiota bacterium]
MKRSEIVLKAFLNRCPPKKRKALERFLPPEEREHLARLPEISAPASAADFSQEEILEGVHWSWFIPTLKSYSEREQRLFLAALSPGVAEQLGQTLSLGGTLEKVSSCARDYLRGQLLHSLAGHRLLPIDFLPPSPLNRLLSLSKKKLMQLIDRLSLYDLAAEMRQIVETKILKKIYSFLSEEQRKALKQLPPPKEAHSIPRLGLDRWDGEEESLRVLLHRRGLTRLGLVLSGQDPDLIWMICHRLDIGRGGSLFKLCAQETTPAMTEMVLKQIEEQL